MYLLRSVTKDIQNILSKNNIIEEIDLRISNLKKFDYQINNLVKYQNIDDIDTIKKDISNCLNNTNIVNNFEFADNLFINLKINESKFLDEMEDIKKIVLLKSKEELIIDYGGPNIGKPLHVGHLRPLNIGRSIYLINKMIGNVVYGDIHLGDWGMPVSQIITYCYTENIQIDTLTIKMLEEVYPLASKKYSENDNFMQLAQENNKKLTFKEKEITSDWEKIRDLTENALLETLGLLGHKFDYWWGESTVNDLIPKMLQDLESDEKIENDGGAKISSEVTDPRILITKSDGSYLYITTDLATVILRNEKINHQKVLYVTDNRQKLHFKQLFSSIKYFDFPEKDYRHVGFGTINDSKGNPLRTRDGGNLKLTELYNQTFEYIKEINKDLEDSEIHCLTNTVLTYSDLVTNRKTDYKFDLEKFTSVSGKTGIYVQYAQVRASRLVEQIDSKYNVNDIDVTLDEVTRNLTIGLANLEFYLELSYKNNEPHHLANYLYELSNLFNTFYQDSNIKNMNDGILKNQKIYVTKLFIKYSHFVMNCLGINPANKM
jgi:arginyl-tRNA synthetase